MSACSLFVGMISANRAVSRRAAASRRSGLASPLARMRHGQRRPTATTPPPPRNESTKRKPPSLPPALRPSLPSCFPPSLPPSLPTYLPTSLPTSLPPSLPPSLPLRRVSYTRSLSAVVVPRGGRQPDPGRVHRLRRHPSHPLLPGAYGIRVTPSARGWRFCPTLVPDPTPPHPTPPHPTPPHPLVGAAPGR